MRWTRSNPPRRRLRQPLPNRPARATATLLVRQWPLAVPVKTRPCNACVASPREGQPALGYEVSGAARPTTLRTFMDSPREEGELTGYASGFVGARFGGRLEVSGVVDPDDGEDVRLDGSYVAGKFGNWIVTLGAQDRWWGSGWEGSLILSNNARPVPAISLDRAVSEPFETKWLSWLGPWRLYDVHGPHGRRPRGLRHTRCCIGMRISARPLDGLEISVERTAQWCGEGRSCTWDDFRNLFLRQ